MGRTLTFCVSHVQRRPAQRNDEQRYHCAQHLPYHHARQHAAHWHFEAARHPNDAAPHVRPRAAAGIAMVGLQHRSEELMQSMRGLDEAGVRAVLVAVLGERIELERRLRG